MHTHCQATHCVNQRNTRRQLVCRAWGSAARAGTPVPRASRHPAVVHPSGAAKLGRHTSARAVCRRRPPPLGRLAARPPCPQLIAAGLLLAVAPSQLRAPPRATRVLARLCALTARPRGPHPLTRPLWSTPRMIVPLARRCRALTTLGVSPVRLGDFRALPVAWAGLWRQRGPSKGCLMPAACTSSGGERGVAAAAPLRPPRSAICAECRRNRASAAPLTAPAAHAPAAPPDFGDAQHCEDARILEGLGYRQVLSRTW